MRFLNLARAEALPEDNAAAVRLHAIRGRHTLAPSPYHNTLDTHQETEPSWTPEVISVEDDHELPE